MMVPFIIAALALFVSAFFSGMETAFVCSNRLRIELNRKQEKFPSGIIHIYTKHPGQFMSILLVGQRIAMVVYGAAAVILFLPAINGSIPFT